MLTIRLQRVGRKNDPSFRVVVVESKRAPKSGSFLEVLGSYDPRVDRIQLKEERIKHWLGHGVQVSDTVNNLFVKAKIMEGKMINVVKMPKKAEAANTVEAKPTEKTAT